MKQYEVTGMNCAACSARVEKAVLGVDGVNTCSVNLLTNSMWVDGTAGDGEIIKAVEDAGYGVKLSKEEETDDFLKDTQTPLLKKRLIYSVGFLAVLMYFSMGHMLGIPMISYFKHNPLANGIVQLLLCTAVLIINRNFFVGGFKAIKSKAPNMDTLVALGSGASFIYSIYALFAMTDSYAKGNISHAHTFLHEFYFESAAMILALITVGKMLESRSKGKTTNALKSLMKLKPKLATVIKDKKEVVIPAEELAIGDIFIVKQGESFPTDAVIVEGSCSVDESALTGESIPVDKTMGDNVSGATINKSGYVKCRVTKTNEETALSQIIKMVSEAAASKAPIAKVADKVSGIFVPAVLIIAIITTVIWLISGEAFGFALARGISVLVISCPCALGLATPVAIMVGSGMGAKNGILFKNASALEETGRIKIVALDKTGTITNGTPKVTDIIPFGKMSKEELLTLAASLEAKSEHPLAFAITEEGKSQNIPLLTSDAFEAVPGNGLKAIIDGKTVCGGNLRFMEKSLSVTEEIKEAALSLSADGKTPLFFSLDNSLIGIIAVADTIRHDSKEAIKELQDMGIRVVMITGDNERTARAIKEQINIDDYHSDVMPDGKENIIRTLKKQGKAAMVGDGINDAPALTSADIGIAIGAGTDVAIDAADIVLMKSSLADVAAAIRLSRKTLKNIHENLFWAFIYNIIGIPLAAGVWIPMFNLKLNPMFGAAAMSLSSFCVVTNALRLNLFNIRNASKDKKIKNKETSKMEKYMKIEGMMCGHCEARVKKCLEELDGVTEAIVSHEKDCATVVLSKDIPDEVLKKTVEGQGYKVL